MQNVRRKVKDRNKLKKERHREGETTKDSERKTERKEGRKKLHSERNTCIQKKLEKSSRSSSQLLSGVFSSASLPTESPFPLQLPAPSHLLSAGEATEALDDRCIAVWNSATVHPGAAVAVDGCQGRGALSVGGDLRLHGGSLTVTNSSAKYGGAVRLGGGPLGLWGRWREEAWKPGSSHLERFGWKKQGSLIHG